MIRHNIQTKGNPMVKKTTKDRQSNQFDVDGKELIAEIVGLADMKTTIGEATGALRSGIKALLEKKGYHSKALAICRDIDAMSETKRADVMRTLIPMMAAMREQKWDAEIKDMLDDE